MTRSEHTEILQRVTSALTAVRNASRSAQTRGSQMELRVAEGSLVDTVNYLNANANANADSHAHAHAIRE